MAFFLSLKVLQNLGKDKFPPQSFEQVGTRIAKVLEKVSTVLRTVNLSSVLLLSQFFVILEIKKKQSLQTGNHQSLKTLQFFSLLASLFLQL